MLIWFIPNQILNFHFITFFPILFRELCDTIMNVVGCIMWIAVGGVALHYWKGYMSDEGFLYVNSERQVGIAMGSLCVIEGALYLLDTVLACIHYSKGDTDYTQ